VALALGADSIKDGRGIGIADLDLDGRLDMVIMNNNETPVILLNRVEDHGNYLLLDLQGSKSNRGAVGAVARIDLDGRTLTRQVTAGNGYASQRMHLLHFGLGERTEIGGLEVSWTSGAVERFDASALAGVVNGLVRIVEGEGVLALEEASVARLAETPQPSGTES
jgi:hypothetical protein